MASIHRRKPDGKWYMNYRDEHNIVRYRSTGTTIREDAQQIANKTESDCAMVRRGVLTSEQIKTSPIKLWSESVRDFQNTLSTSNCSEKHKQDSLRVVRKFGEYLANTGKKNPRVADVGRNEIEGYIAELSANGAASKSRSKHLVILRRFLRLSGLDGAKDKEISKVTIKAKTETKRRMLSLDEWAALKSFLLSGKARPSIYNLSPKQRLTLMRLAISTGLRVKEMRSLRVDDLREENGGEKTYTVICRDTKNSKIAYLPIDHELFVELKEEMQNHGGKLPVPSSSATSEIARKDLRDCREWFLGEEIKKRIAELNHEPSTEELKNIGQEVGKAYEYFLTLHNASGEVYTWHSLRHSFISHLCLQGTPINIVQQAARHASINTTLRYSHLYPSSLKDEIRKFTSRL